MRLILRVMDNQFILNQVLKLLECASRSQKRTQNLNQSWMNSGRIGLTHSFAMHHRLRHDMSCHFTNLLHSTSSTKISELFIIPAYCYPI